MKMMIKISCVAALALTMTIFGAQNARARGWVVAGGVGVTVGPAVGVSVAAGPVYYTAPAPVVTVAPAYCYGPRVVCAAPYHPYLRVGYGWGPRYHYGGHFYRR
jgi:hypothetical protein